MLTAVIHGKKIVSVRGSRVVGLLLVVRTLMLLNTILHLKYHSEKHSSTNEPLTLPVVCDREQDC